MNAMERYQQWCSNPYFDEATRAELKALADAGNTAEIQDRFYRDLAFGTGGLRVSLGATQQPHELCIPSARPPRVWQTSF